MKIVIPDYVDMDDEVKQALRAQGADVFDDTPAETELCDRIKDADLITANYYDLTPKLIDAAPNLKFVISPAVGYEWIDVVYAKQKGIVVMNCPTFNGQAVAEQAFALLGAVARKVVEAA